MRTKIKTSNVHYYILFLLCTSLLGFYSEQWTGIYYRDFINLTLIIVSAIYIAYKRFTPLNTGKLNYSKWIIIGIILYFVEVAYSSFYLNQSIVVSLKCSFGLLSIIIYYWLNSLINTHDKYMRFRTILVHVAILMSVVSIVQEIVYLMNGIVILGVSDVVNSYIRNDRLRIRIDEGLPVLAIYFITFNVIKKKKINVKEIISLLVLISNLTLIIQTRSVILYGLAALLLGTRHLLGKNYKKRLLYSLLIVSGLVIAVAIKYSEIMVLLSNFFADSSILIRFDEIGFYFSNFLSYPVLGRGFISGSDNYLHQLMLKGPSMRFSRSDVGIMGFLDERGIVGTIWFLAGMQILYKATKRTKDIYKMAESKSILVFMIIGAITNLFPLLDSGYSFSIMAIIIMKNMEYGSYAIDIRSLT